MRKLLMLVTMLLVPTLASAWTLPVKVTNTTAGIAAGNKATVTVGATSTDVTVGTKYFYPANTVTEVSVAIANIGNVTSITLDGATQPLTSPVTVTRGAASLHSLNIVYASVATAPKANVALTQTPGGLTTLSVGSSSTTSGYTGVAVGTAVTVKAQPSTGYSLTNIKVNDVVVATSSPYTFAVADTTADSVVATYAKTPVITAALGLATSGQVGTAVTATATASTTGTAPLAYAWTVNGAAAGTAATQSITPVAGANLVYVTVSSADATSVTKSATIQGVDLIAAGNYSCTSCHAGSTPAIVSAYNAGAHGNTGLSCQTCHNGTTTHGEVSPVIQLGTPAAITPDANGFVTANACQNCHKTAHDEWKESLHTLKSKKGPALLGGSTENISPWAITNWNTMKTYQILGRKSSSGNNIELYVSVDKKQPQDVAVVIGQDRKQRYAVYYDGSAQQAKVVYSNNGGITYREKMIDHDNDPETPTVWEEVAMPAQPDRAGYMFLWLEVKLADGTTPAMNGNNYEEWRSWQERCIACHTTGFDRVAYNTQKTAYKNAFIANGNQPPADSNNNMRTVYVSEWEISCESCHGAGAEHAQTGDKTKIISPAKLAQGDHVRKEVCTQCHTRTNKNLVDTATANDRRGFRLGVDSYGDWMDYTSPAWGSGNRQVSIDGKGRRDHQMTMDIQLSKYIHEVIKGGFSYHGNQDCFDCHKSHDVGITAGGVNVWKSNLNAGQYGHSNMKSLETDDGVRSTLRLKDTREALCSSCHVTAAPAGVLPQGVTAPQYATVTDLVKVMNAANPSYGFPFDSTANWATEGGRGSRNQHLFNTDVNAATTNKAMGLVPAEYTWQVLNANIGSTSSSHYTAIWPWANAATGYTKVYGPLPTGPSSKAPTTSRPWTP